MNSNTAAAPIYGVLPVLPWPLQALTAETSDKSLDDLFAKGPHSRIHVPVIAQSLWNRLLATLRTPVKTIDVDGLSVVQVVDVARFYRDPDGSLQVQLWTRSLDSMRWQVATDEDVVITGMPKGRRWLVMVRDAACLEVERHHRQAGLTVSVGEVTAYVAVLFNHFATRIRRHCDLRLMRRRVAKALALDPEVIRLARRLQNRMPATDVQPPGEVQVRDYNLVLAHKADFLKLEIEMPQLIPLYGALLIEPHFVKFAEPAVSVRAYLKEVQLRPQVWRLLAHAGPRLFVPMRSFYKGRPGAAMLDYLALLDAMQIQGEPDPGFMWAVLSRYGNAGAPKSGYVKFMRPLCQKFGHAALAYMALTDRQDAGSDLELILEWLEVEAPKELAKTQRRAGLAMVGEIGPGLV